MKKEIWLFDKKIIPIENHVAFFIHPSADQTKPSKHTECCCDHFKNYEMNTT